MEFLYPLGLLGLIAIPVLIIIYILTNRFTEQTVSSTYLWTLSEKFLKKKRRINKLTGIISLILQIVAVAALSIAIAHPVIVLPGQAFEYCFILDGSGSMNMETNGKTRFERGKEEIVSLIEDSKEGSYYTIIYIGDATRAVCTRVERKDQALLMLGELQPSHVTGNLADAVGLAQEAFHANNALKTYMVTDKAHESHKNIQLINLAGGEQNYAVSDVAYTQSGEQITVMGKAVSYESDATLTVELYADGKSEALDSVELTVTAKELAPFNLRCTLEEFYSLEVKIKNQDALALDNGYVLYNTKSENAYDTLIVSEEPFLLKSVIEAVSNAKAEVVSPSEYKNNRGYGLYVFDSFNPGTMPEDGAVWLFNLGTSLPNAGFSVQGEETIEGNGTLQMTDSTASEAQKLTRGVNGKGIYITQYYKYGIYSKFTTLFSYHGNPMIFTGNTPSGNREVVMAFDLNNSDFALSTDFVILAKNLLDYSFPEVVEKVGYVCGEKLEINVPANCDSVKVESPLGETTYLSNANGGINEYLLNEAGIYTITMTVAGTPRYYHVFSALDEGERAPVVTAAAVDLQGEAGTQGLDGKLDDLMLLFVALVVLFLADWGLYCYDKYQLR